MADQRSIFIDFDVHKLIENERRGFDESENTVLRRLLGLEKGDEAPIADGAAPTGRRWTNGLVSLPHGTEVKMNYNGRAYEGRIEDGNWVFEEGRFNSPSGAASSLAVTRAGKKTSLDGYKYWWVRKPGETAWVHLGNLQVHAEQRLVGKTQIEAIISP